ncbi:MAG: beta-lactamase family protein [Acidobacteriia bacterium]|nr:beta-lactamase family protein [Terriglobia bacterium]
MIRKFVSALLLIGSATVGVRAGVDETTRSKLDAIFMPLANGRSPGLAVLVQKDGRAFFRKGYGVRNLRTLSRIDAETNFRLASFTKQFTAMAIMLLVHDGKLRYGEPLSEVFPDFPAYGRTITMRQLLAHTSGLPDYEDLMAAAEKAQGTTWTAAHQIQDDEVLGLLKLQTHGKFAPGTSWSYSNSGYVVLGLVVAKVSGKPFGRFLHDRIFVPLQMRNTLAYMNGRNAPTNRAYGHTWEGTQFVETDQSSTSATLGDGGVYSNLEDLAKWDGALRTGALLSQEEMKAGLAAARLVDGSEPHWPMQPGEDNLNPGKPVSYGFGWFLDPYKGRARMWHSGNTMGFRTVIERFTEENLTVIILCNRTDLDPSVLALRAADVVH